MKKTLPHFILLCAIMLAIHLVACTTISANDFDAHKPSTKLHSDDGKMDFALALIMGATMNHGAEIGDAFYTAGQIKEGDADKWQAEWIKIAERVQARGGACLAGLTNPNKKMVTPPADKGASNHCLLENRSVLTQVLFDWLDPTLAPIKPGRRHVKQTVS